MNRRERLTERQRAVEDSLFAHVRNQGRLAVVQAPPGSGKTHLLLNAAAVAVAAGQRVAVVAQTNTQADDIVKRCLKDHPRVEAFRFLSTDAEDPPGLPARNLVRASKELRGTPCMVVGTSAKWGLSSINPPFDVMLIDEAWQLCWADFMPLGRCAGRFVLIGDPGQIPPTVPVDSSRWATSPRPPHRPTPEVVLGDPGLEVLRVDLPATRRLPADSATLVRGFYEFDFDSWAEPADRLFRPGTPGRQDRLDRVIDLLVESSTVGLTLPTPAGGPPVESDEELAHEVVRLVEQIIARGIICARRDDTRNPDDRELEPAQIGISSTHRLMNSCLGRALPRKLGEAVRIDTPERWQGLERDVMIVVHPLAGVVHPTSFDLETGRLCVMASRHRIGMVVVTRDHLADTLARFLPAADQAIGAADVSGRGHDGHVRFWDALERQGRVVKG